MGFWLSFLCPSPAFIYNIYKGYMEISSVYNKKRPFMFNIRMNVYVKVGEHEFFLAGEKKKSSLSTELLNLTNISLNYPTYLQ